MKKIEKCGTWKVGCVVLLLLVLAVPMVGNAWPGGGGASSTQVTENTAAIATKVDMDSGTATNLTVDVVNYTAVSNTTTYVAELTWDATNKVFKVTETAQ